MFCFYPFRWHQLHKLKIDIEYFENVVQMARQGVLTAEAMPIGNWRVFLAWERHRIEINRRAPCVRTFEVCVPTHVALCTFIMHVLASQLPFLANRNTQLAVLPLFWPVNCIKIGRHVALLSGLTVCSLQCRQGICTDCPIYRLMKQ